MSDSPKQSIRHILSLVTGAVTLVLGGIAMAFLLEPNGTALTAAVPAFGLLTIALARR